MKIKSVEELQKMLDNPKTIDQAAEIAAAYMCKAGIDKPYALGENVLKMILRFATVISLGDQIALDLEKRVKTLESENDRLTKKLLPKGI